MSLSVRRFGQLTGATTLNGMAQKLGIMSRPLSVRDMILRFGLPLQPNLSLSWLEGNFPKHPVNHPPDSNSVPVTVEGGVSLVWDDPGKGSQRTASAWTLHFKEGNSQDKISLVTFPSVGEPLDFDTVYTWSVIPENEFGQGPSSSVFAFKTEIHPLPPPPPPPPPPVSKTLVLTVSVGIPAQRFFITGADWRIFGPGVPQELISGQVGTDGHSAQAKVSLPSGQSSTTYQIFSTVAFHYDALTGPSGITGAEDTQVDLQAPITITWTSDKDHIALFGIRYDTFKNVFTMRLDSFS